MRQQLQLTDTRPFNKDRQVGKHSKKNKDVDVTTVKRPSESGPAAMKRRKANKAIRKEAPKYAPGGSQAQKAKKRFEAGQAAQAANVKK